MPLAPLRAPALAACLALAAGALAAVGPPAAASARAITQPTNSEVGGFSASCPGRSIQ